MAYYNGKKILKKILVQGSNIVGVTEENNTLKIEGYGNSNISIYDENKTIATNSNSNVNVNGDGSTININGDNTVNNYASTVTLNTYGGSYVANNLAAENIKSGVTILGHTGTYEGSGGGSVTIPTVTNIQLNSNGYLTFECDTSSLSEYTPTITYLINVNGFELTSTKTSINIGGYLREGSNEISVITKAVLNDTSNKNQQTISYSMPQFYCQVLDATLPHEVGTNPVVIPLNKYVYIFGGNTKKIIKFDSETKTSEVLEALFSVSALNQATGQLIGTDVYIFDGVYSRNIFKFDTITETITTLGTQMPFKSTNAHSGLVNQTIYVLGGGSSDDNYYGFKFDITTETVTKLGTKAPTNLSSQQCYSALIGTNIYIFGANSRHIYIFDTVSETYTTLSTVIPSKCGEYAQGGVVKGTFAYLFGGQWSDKIFEFDSINQTCTVLDVTLHEQMRNLKGAVVGADIYLFHCDYETTILKAVV